LVVVVVVAAFALSGALWHLVALVIVIVVVAAVVSTGVLWPLIAVGIVVCQFGPFVIISRRSPIAGWYSYYVLLVVAT
jgi:hypothetical protein